MVPQSTYIIMLVVLGFFVGFFVLLSMHGNRERRREEKIRAEGPLKKLYSFKWISPNELAVLSMEYVIREGVAFYPGEKEKNEALMEISKGYHIKNVHVADPRDFNTYLVYVEPRSIDESQVLPSIK